MTSRTIERPMSDAEKREIDRILLRAPSKSRRLKEGAENALVLWAVSMLAFVLVWWFAAWAARAAFHWEIGWNSPAAIWIVILGASAAAVIAARSTRRWLKGWRDTRPLLRADIDGGQVVEEHYEFDAAKRFQEPEHGGLMYFLRTTEDQVLVVYDYESQNRGVRDEDPLSGAFQPTTNLVLVRAPNSGFVISEQFSGAPVTSGPPRELTVAPKFWPEDRGYCDIPWSDLENRLSLHNRRAAG
jgi:hypothetical protein